MPWIDITRNIDTIPSFVEDLFTFNGILWAVVRYGSGVLEDSYVEEEIPEDPAVYKIMKHLGADPPIIDTIWSGQYDFPPTRSNENRSASIFYKPGGHAEDVNNGFIYLANKNTGEIYINSTPFEIDGNWNILSGPYGVIADLPAGSTLKLVGADAEISSLIFFQGKLYVGFKGGIATLNPADKEFSLVDIFSDNILGDGTAVSFIGHREGLYVAVSYPDAGYVYKYTKNVNNKDNREIYARLPEGVKDPLKLLFYNNKIMLITSDIEGKKIFNTIRGTEIVEGSTEGNTEGNTAKFIEGTSLEGVPSSALIYSKDNKIWITCTGVDEAVHKYWKAGDVNNDGVVDSVDAGALSTLTFPMQWYAADFDNTDSITPEDITIFNSYISGEITQLPNDFSLSTVSYKENKIINIPLSSSALAFTTEDVEDINLAMHPCKFLGASIYGVPLSSGVIIPSNSVIAPIEDPTPTRTLIEFPAQVHKTGAEYEDVRDFGLMIFNGSLPFSALGKYTISFNIETINPPEVISAGIHQSSTIQFKLGIADVNSPVSTKYLTGYNLPTPAIRVISNANSTRISYTFDASNLTNLENFPDTIRPKLLINVTLPGIYAVGDGSFDPFSKKPPGEYQNYNFRPKIILTDIQIKAEENIIYSYPEFIYKEYNSVPSMERNYISYNEELPGDNNWFIKFPSIINSVGNLVRPENALIPNYFSGTLVRRIITNEFSLSTDSTTYKINYFYYITTGNNRTYTVYAYFRNIITGNIIDIDRIANAANIGTVAKTCTVTNTSGGTYQLVIDLLEDISGDTEKFSAAAFYISDINVVEEYTNDTLHNCIYQSVGTDANAWSNNINTVSNIIYPTGYQNAAMHTLTENYDIRSKEYQLYALGLGKIWVYHYDGSLYDETDRPQIISMV